jgi:hypothetical protein
MRWRTVFREPVYLAVLLIAVSRRCRSAGGRRLALAGVRAALAGGDAANTERISIEPSLLGGDLHRRSTRRCGRNRNSLNPVMTWWWTLLAAFSPSAGNPRLVSALASLWVRAREASTGGRGETAAALLARLGVNGIRLLDEIEPGFRSALHSASLGSAISRQAATKVAKRIIEDFLHQADRHSGASLPDRNRHGGCCGHRPEIVMALAALEVGALCNRWSSEMLCG